jgi:hypothetical protein
MFLAVFCYNSRRTIRPFTVIPFTVNPFTVNRYGQEVMKFQGASHKCGVLVSSKPSVFQSQQATTCKPGKGATHFAGKPGKAQTTNKPFPGF